MKRRFTLTPEEAELIEKHRQRNSHIALGLEKALDIIAEMKDNQLLSLQEHETVMKIVQKIEKLKKDLQS